MNENEVFKIGRLVKLHGVKGKVEMSFTDDVFDRSGIDYLFLRVDGLLVPFFIDSYSFKGANRVLIKFDDIDDTSSAQRLVNSDVFFPYAEIPDRESDEDMTDYLIGYRLYNAPAEYVGEVTDIDTQSANTLLFVKTPNDNNVMIPLHPELVSNLDEKQRTITMNLPEGLLQINRK